MPFGTILGVLSYPESSLRTPYFIIAFGIRVSPEKSLFWADTPTDAVPLLQSRKHRRRLRKRLKETELIN